MANSAEIPVSCNPQSLVCTPQRGGRDWTGNGLFTGGAQAPRGRLAQLEKMERNKAHSTERQPCFSLLGVFILLPLSSHAFF